MIKAAGVGKRAGDIEILRDVNFVIPTQSVLGIIGASGCGKTTLLRCLNGLERIDSGVIEFDDLRLEAGLSSADYQRRVKALRRKVSIVFQQLYLFPHLTVLDNVIAAPIHVLGMTRQAAADKADELLDAVGVKHTANRYPESLSGGEQQRVAIARALAMRPEILLFDEPTSALDIRHAADLQKILLRFIGDGHTMVIVSHAIKFLEGLATHLLYMESGEAIEFAETDVLLNRPSNSRTQEFMRQAQ